MPTSASARLSHATRIPLLPALRRRARARGAEGERARAARLRTAAVSSSTSIRRSPSARSSTPADALVLVRRAIEPGYGKWVFPGGYVDRGEPLTAAAIREAREECGLDVRLDGLVNIYSYPGRAPVIVVYAATAIGGDARASTTSAWKRLSSTPTRHSVGRSRLPQHARRPARLSRRRPAHDVRGTDGRGRHRPCERRALANPLVHFDPPYRRLFWPSPH